MKRHVFIASLIIGLLAASVFAVGAQCDSAGTAGSDNITCTGTSTTVQGLESNDTITIEGTLNGNVIGGADADTIIVNGTVNFGNIYGDITGSNQTADDTIIINGTVNGAIIADSSTSNIAAGNDTIIINGTVIGNVIGDSTSQLTTVPGGNDTFILQDGANGGSDNTLVLIGVTGNDTLVFELTMNSEADYLAASDAIAAGNPNGASIVINGQTYQWILFDQLINALIKGYSTGTPVPPGTPVVITIPVVPSQPAAPADPIDPPDGRINWNDRGFAPVAIYCGGGAVQVYNPEGQMLFMSDANAIIAGFEASADVNQPVGGGAGFSLWTLNSTRELQVHADAGGYDFIFPALCIA